MFAKSRAAMPTLETALRGRSTRRDGRSSRSIICFLVPPRGPYPEGLEVAIFGLGCFWGAERLFWQLGEGIWITAVGYAGGFTENPYLLRKSAPDTPATPKLSSSL